MNGRIKKKRVLMLAVCQPAAIGGQATCARMLLENYKEVDWILQSFPLPGQYNLPLRIIVSCNILIHAIWICINRKIDVVHLMTACSRSALFEKLIIGRILKITGVKVVINFQGAFDQYYATFSGREQRFVRRSLQQFDIILCLHNDMKKFLNENAIVDDQKIRVIPNGVVIEPEIVKVNSGQNRFKLVYLGWIVSNKGLHTLVKAVANLKKQYHVKDFSLDIIGPEVEQGLIAKLQNELQNEGLEDLVKFHPPVFGNEKGKVFAEADVFIFPTRMEGFPFVLLEAMQSGLAVITTNISPMNLIVEHNKNGMLFEKDNSVDLAKQIFTLMTNNETRERVGIEARKHIVSGYSVERVIEMYSKLYDGDL